MGVGGVGVDEVEDPAAQDLEGLWRRTRRLGRAGGLRPSRICSGSRSAGRSASARRITWACSTWRAPAASAVRMRSCCSSPSASRTARWARAGWCWWSRRASSRSRTWRCLRAGRSGRVRQEPGLQLGELRLGGLDLADRVRGLRGVHGPHRHLGHRGQLIAHASDGPGDRVWLVGERCHGTHSSTDHRHPRVAGIPVWTTDPYLWAVDGKWSLAAGGLDKLYQQWAERVPTLRWFRDGRRATSSTSGGHPPPPRNPSHADVPSRDRRQVPAEAVVVSTSSSGGGRAGCLPCGGFETVAERPPQPAVVTPRHRGTAARPAGGNPIASPPLTLGSRVADNQPSAALSRLSPEAHAPDRPTV